MIPVTWPPALEHGMGDRAHQAEIAAAIDEAYVVLRENPAEMAAPP